MEYGDAFDIFLRIFIFIFQFLNKLYVKKLIFIAKLYFFAPTFLHKKKQSHLLFIISFMTTFNIFFNPPIHIDSQNTQSN